MFFLSLLIDLVVLGSREHAPLIIFLIPWTWCEQVKEEFELEKYQSKEIRVGVCWKYEQPVQTETCILLLLLLVYLKCKKYEKDNKGILTFSFYNCTMLINLSFFIIIKIF